MKNVIILGATGSIGTTAINAILSHALPVHVVALSCHRKKDELRMLGKRFPTRNFAFPEMHGTTATADLTASGK